MNTMFCFANKKILKVFYEEKKFAHVANLAIYLNRVIEPFL